MFLTFYDCFVRTQGLEKHKWLLAGFRLMTILDLLWLAKWDNSEIVVRQLLPWQWRIIMWKMVIHGGLTWSHGEVEYGTLWGKPLLAPRDAIVLWFIQHNSKEGYRGLKLSSPKLLFKATLKNDSEEGQVLVCQRNKKCKRQSASPCNVWNRMPLSFALGLTGNFRYLLPSLVCLP